MLLKHALMDQLPHVLHWIPWACELCMKALLQQSKPCTISELACLLAFVSHGVRVRSVMHDSVPGGRSELGYICLAQQRVADAEKCMRRAAQLQAAAPVLPFSELPRVFCQ